MALPNIPNILPEISLERCKTIELLLSSIALEEISLSHLLNAEGEKLQLFLKTNPTSLKDYLKINASVNQTIRAIIKSQILLHFKLEDILALDEKADRCSKKKDKCPSPEQKHDHKHDCEHDHYHEHHCKHNHEHDHEPPKSLCDQFYEDDDF